MIFKKIPLFCYTIEEIEPSRTIVVAISRLYTVGCDMKMMREKSAKCESLEVPI